MPFVASDFGTVAMHLKASSAGVADGGAVSSATVLTGDTLSGVSGGNPTYNATSALNSKPGITFSRTGTDDALASSGSNYLDGVQRASFACVIRFSALDATTQYIFSQQSPAPRTIRFSLYYVNGGILGCYASSTGSSHEGLSAGSTIAVDTNYVIVGTVEFTGASNGTIKVWLNGTRVITKSDLSGALFDTTNSTLGFMVSGFPGLGQGVDGVISELVIWQTVLTEADAREIHSHLRNDYLTPPYSPSQLVVAS